MSTRFRRKFARDSDDDSEMVLRIAGDILGLPKSTLDRNLHLKEDFDADYINKREMMMAVEELMGVDIDPDKTEDIELLGDFLDVVEESMNSDKSN